ncbi:hypothetical protein D9M71_769680 [compost metagenome]
MGHAVTLVDRGEADVAYTHFPGAHCPVVRIPLCQHLPELVVVLSGSDPGRRGAYELGGIQRDSRIHVHFAAKGLVEKALVSLEELPYAGFHHLFSGCG